MIRPICKDILFLSMPSLPADRNDRTIAQDLMDTLNAHSQSCVGMAANMIGQNRCIIAISLGPLKMILFNPVITSRSGKYTAEEGCLSLSGARKTERYQHIEVEYYDSSWTKKKQKFSGFPAQVIQHEIDHLSGKII